MVPTVHVKLKRQLFDLFQHCELKCRAHCCGWDAFDLSRHWVHRWCEFRDADSIAEARHEIACLLEDLSGRDQDDIVSVDGFFDPSLKSLSDQINEVDAILGSAQR